MPPHLVAIVRASVAGRDVPDELEAVLADRVARAAAAWPEFTVPGDRFVQVIAERLSPELPVASALDAIHTDDLYLAHGCADGDRAALAAFEAHCGAAIVRAIATTGASPSEAEDLGQVIRQRLLVPPAAGGPARIASYSARGSLPAWIRVVATREAARLLAVARRTVPVGDDELARLIAPDDDPELGYLKRLYRDEFRSAFAAAVEALDDGARLMLRQHTLDGLGLDQLAALHGIHRATVARRLEAARAAILRTTQRQLMERLQLDRAELDRVFRMIVSQLHVSLQRLLS